MLTFFVVFASGLYIRSARAAGGALDFLEVHDPVGVVQCDQYNLTWQGGVPPFSVQVRDPVQQGNIYAFWAIVQDEFILWDVDKLGVAPGSLPLTFEVAVSDSTGTTATSRTESVAPATIALDASGLCTSIITPGADSGTTTSSSSSTTAQAQTSTTTTPTTSPTSPTTSGKATSPTGSATKLSASGTSSVSGSSTGSTSASAASSADAAAGGTTTSSKKVSSGAIAGGVIGGIILISLLGTLFAFLRRRHQKALLDDLTANDYHLALHGKIPPPEDGVEKPLPAFYEPIKPGSTPPPQPAAAYYHDASASPSLQSHPSSGYLPASASQLTPYPSPYHDMPHAHPHMDVTSQQMELERQIGVMQQEINEMQTAAHTQTLQNQVNTMRGELERLRMAQNGYR